MNVLRELTTDEMINVWGGGGTPTFTSTPISGGTEWRATCGSGYSISPNFNTQATQSTSYATSTSAWSCTAGESGVEDYTFLSSGASSFNFSGYSWHGE